MKTKQQPKYDAIDITHNKKFGQYNIVTPEHDISIVTYANQIQIIVYIGKGKNVELKTNADVRVINFDMQTRTETQAKTDEGLAKVHAEQVAMRGTTREEHLCKDDNLTGEPCQCGKEDDNVRDEQYPNM